MTKKEKFSDRIDAVTKKLKGPCGSCKLWFMNFESDPNIPSFCKDSCEEWKKLSKEDQQYNTEIINAFLNLDDLRKAVFSNPVE